MRTFHKRVDRPMPDLGALVDDRIGTTVYLDIETTGLSPREAHVTLVGLVHGDGAGRSLTQYFVPSPADEAAVLAEVADHLRDFAWVVTYNGDRFDLPFLQSRAAQHRFRWPELQSLDLLPMARAWRDLHGGLPDCKLQTVMHWFGVGRGDATSGWEMVQAYERWLQDGIAGDRDLILTHNADDLLYLPELVPLLITPSRRRRA